MKKALITGITGQDGSYLAEFLLEKGYEVHGLQRRSSTLNIDRITHIYQDPHLKNARFFLHYGDMTDSLSLSEIIRKIQPDEVYNLAAQSHVFISFETPEYTADSDAVGTLRILQAIKNAGLINKTKFYQASTSELYGKATEIPQKETTPFYPRSPYGVAKLYAYWMAGNYREAYGLFACNGILFNHESPRRGTNFVSRKVVISAVKISAGIQDCLYLGNLYAKRDWGYAKEYVESMWLMLQKDKPQDYVISTGETHTVKEFVDLTFKELGIDLIWEGSGVEEVAKDKKTGKVAVRIDPYFFRPAEVDLLLGDPSKAKRELGWESKTKFADLVKLMVKEELNQFNRKDRSPFYYLGDKK